MIATYKQNDWAKALTLLDGLITEQPDNPYLWELKGQIYLKRDALPWPNPLTKNQWR